MSFFKFYACCQFSFYHFVLYFVCLYCEDIMALLLYVKQMFGHMTLISHTLCSEKKDSLLLHVAIACCIDSMYMKIPIFIYCMLVVVFIQHLPTY